MTSAYQMFAFLAELNRRRKAAKQSDDYAKLAEVYNELGDEYRRLGDLEKAVKKQIKCVFNAETIGSLEYQVYAHRAVAEMYIELADYDLARKHANEHLRAAELYNKAHLIQLAYHVKGWVLLQFWTAIVESKSNDSTADAEELLIEAKRSLEKSLAYLNANSSKISADKEARNGGDVNRRRAGVQQVLSEVYDKLGQHTDAITFHLAALKYAERNEDLDLQYRCLFSKLGFSEEDKLRTTQQMLAVAEKMAKAGDKSRKYEALIQFAEAKINVEDFLGAKDAFETVYLEGKACVPKEDWNNARKSLICLYKIAQRVEALHGLAEHDHRLRMRLADKIGDDLCEMNAFDTAVTFYLRVLDAANALRSPKDVLAAATSVASTAFDANQFSLALEYYEKLLALETSAGQSEKKLANTRVCIAKSAVEADGLSVDRVVEYCSDAALACANAQAVSNEVETLKCLCDYLKRKASSHPKLSEASSRLAAAEGEMDGGDSDEEEGEEATAADGFSDDLDLLTPERILQLCKDEFKLRNEDDKIRHEKDKVINSHGETRMHDAARGDDLDYLKKLVKAGYNVNARDYGKWTPLMEAVNANKIDNVRHLLQHNANVNAQSGQGIVDEDKERESASGLTPLMGAAEMLYLPIIRLLIAHPNINLSVKNSDGWTALDMLEDALRRRVADTGIDPDDHAEANRLIAELRRRMLSHGAALVAPPPRSTNRPTGRKAVLSNLRQRNRQAPSVAKVYEDIMVGLGRGQVHRRCGMASPEPPADPSEDRQVAIDEMNDFIVPDADDDVAIVEQPLIEDYVASLPQSTNKRRLDAVEERQPRKRRSRLRSAYNAEHQRAFEPLSSFTNDDNFASIGFESTPIFDTVPV
uniref:Tonsoku-like protein n=1 Tax=Plectus sambesii TaxID=2011161 RepID=A0A914WKM9_9BILA